MSSSVSPITTTRSSRSSSRANTPRPKPLSRLDEYRLHRRLLRPGTEVSIRGERGRFVFNHATVASTGAVSLTFVGGPPGAEKWRSFRPDRVRTVHRVAISRRTAH